MSRLMVVAGEASGDQHAAGLLRELKKGPWGRDLQVLGSGGEALRAEGAELILDIERLAAIGPWEALANVRSYWSLYSKLKEEIRNRPPDLAILVDFPDFNLRLAPFLKKTGVPVCYFISPQIWAWRESRVKQIRRFVDLMLVIFPFEEDYFRSQGVDAHYVGNPSTHRVSRIRQPGLGTRKSDEDWKLVLLPGSRRAEVERLLPVQIEAAACVARRHPLEVRVLAASGLDRGILERTVSRCTEQSGAELKWTIVEGAVDMELAEADIALVKSGTSTLEATLVGVPFAMVYRLSLPSWLLLKPLVRAPYYSLPNWIAGERLVPEFVQWEATGENIGSYLSSLLEDPEAWQAAYENLRKIARKLGKEDAYRQAASKIEERFPVGSR